MNTHITLKFFLAAIYLLLSLGLQAQGGKSATIHVATAGTLPTLISSADKYLITDLALTGYLNGTDIKYIREMAGCDSIGESTDGDLSVLNISEANIVAGGDAYFLNYFTANNIIGEWMFNQGSLTTVLLPKSVSSIDAFAFLGCYELTSISISSGVTSIGAYAFMRCESLTSVSIPNGVTNIEAFAFGGCESLTSVSIPNNVANIGIGSFGENNLKEFIVSEDNSNYSTIDGVLTNKEKNELIAYPNAKSSAYTIPDGITSIRTFAFAYCDSLISINIPESVTSIGTLAFAGCVGLTSVTIPNSITSIEIGTFTACDSLSSITIPSSVNFIGEEAFSGCNNLASVTIPNSVTTIENRAFSECEKLKEFIISDENPNYSSINGVLTSKDKTRLIACLNPGTKTYTIPDGITSIGEYAFSSCTDLTSITIPESVTTIENTAFSGCKTLEKFIISDKNSNYSFIDAALVSKDKTRLIAFTNAGLNTYTIPENITSIGAFAFYESTGLNSIIITNGVTSIEDGAFATSNIDEFIVSGNNPNYASIDGNLVSKDKTRLVAMQDPHEYLDFLEFSNTIDIIIPNSITSIGAYAFYINNVHFVTIPNNVTSIGDYAFSRSGLTSITIPNSVTSIGKHTFESCLLLTSATLPNNITSIKESTFRYCFGLSSITIPNSVTYIGDYAFNECSLNEIHSNASTPPATGTETFSAEIYPACKLYVPKGSLNAYKTAPVWQDFINIIEEKTTNVNSIANDPVLIYDTKNGITIETDKFTAISIYNIGGALIYQSTIGAGVHKIALAKGMYIVSADAKRMKVCVR